MTTNENTGQNIGYARISTSEQDLALQHKALAEAKCSTVFSDTASGAKAERVELDACLRHLRPGDTLVVWKLDRLGRSTRHLAELVESLGDRGVEFRSITEGLDTSTPSGRLIFHIMSAIAEFERDLIRERTKAGLEAMKDRGKRLGGRPSVMSDEKVQAARELARTGMSKITIAATLNVSRATLYRHLA